MSATSRIIIKRAIFRGKRTSDGLTRRSRCPFPPTGVNRDKNVILRVQTHLGQSQYRLSPRCESTPKKRSLVGEHTTDSTDHDPAVLDATHYIATENVVSRGYM